MRDDLTNIGNIACFQAGNLNKIQAIKHGFLTRQGGVSTAEFTSLNCALAEASLDEPSAIDANMEIVCRSFNIARSQLFTVKQVHEAGIYKATTSAMSPEPVADAIISTQKGVALGIRTADCVPILLSSGSGDIIAAVHAGWPSTYAGIIQDVVKRMVELGAELNQIVASVGPAIAGDSYEVGKEIILRFTRQSYEYSAYFKKSERYEHYMFNLSGLAAKILDNAGVRNIEHLKIDTYENDDLLFSHRRATHQNNEKEGRQLSVIMISAD